MPIEGSSRSSSFGLAISARPIASICCSPPDIVPAFWRSRSLSRGNSSNTRSMSSPTLAVAAQVGAEVEVLPHGHALEAVAALGGLRDAEPHDVLRRGLGDLVALEADRALGRGGVSPEIDRSVVDLPAPFEPISVTISPSSTSSEMPFSASMLP